MASCSILFLGESHTVASRREEEQLRLAIRMLMLRAGYVAAERLRVGQPCMAV
jgi:hypothetical protein